MREEGFNNSKYRSIKKNVTEIVKILAKSKICNLPKFMSRNLSKFRKVSSAGAIQEYNFLIPSTRITFTKLRHVFIYLVNF